MFHFLTPLQLSKYLQLSKSTVWRIRQKDATFPKPFKLLERTVLFDKTEIDAWLEESRAK